MILNFPCSGARVGRRYRGRYKKSGALAGRRYNKNGANQAPVLFYGYFCDDIIFHDILAGFDSY